MPAIVPFEPAHLPACRAIFETIPEWFGIAASNEKYLRELGELPAFVAVESDAVVGFASLRTHFPEAAELEVLAVRRDLHRRGAGRALVSHCEDWLRARGVAWLHVKTLAPSDPDPGYAKTRAFYRALGFAPLFETELWGPGNPTLISVKRLAP
ncbi:MAG TPA: GNAT family N-acetyltransferase [Myxococcota bacterium]|nr:GNAT family N-acetyltransferase [Myxococcota bacterium]